MARAWRELEQFYAEREQDALVAVGNYWRGAGERLDEGERETFREAPDVDKRPAWWRS